MYLLRLLLAGGFAGTDGPDRLISDDRIGEGLRPALLEHRFQLFFDDPLGVPGLALMQAFAHAQHRHQPGTLGRQELPGDQFIGLLLVLTALGMADQHVAAADVGQHFGGDIAGKGALHMHTDILRAENESRAGITADQVVEDRQRRDDQGFHGRIQGRRQGIQQGFAEGAAAVELPVPRHDFFPHVAPLPDGLMHNEEAILT